MKIYTRCVYGWQPDGSLTLEESDSFDYEGPVALCKDSPSTPAAPDYTGAAQAQGAANLTSAQQGAVLSNPNIYSPYGNQNVSYSPLGGNNPATSGFLSPTITQTLNPQSQQIFNAQQATKLGLAGLGQQGLNTAQSVMGTPFNYSGPGIQTSLSGYGTPQNAPNLTGMGSANQNLNLSNMAAMPVNAGTTGQAALMARLQPQIDQSHAMAQTQLANQGLTAGGEAYDNAMRVQNQSENDLRSQAALQGINLDLSANQQGYGQALQSGQFSNQALAQNQTAALQQQQAQNQAIAQGYNQQLGAGQFGNTAAQQALAQQLQQYNIPLNQISALMSGSQIQNPQFQGYQGQNVQPAPLFNAAQNQAQYNQGIYGLGVGQQNAQMQGLASLGGSAMGMYALSDRRLKSNIERIGAHPLGIGIYEYDIFGERDRGVMADEVLMVKPEAVMTHPSGFLMVDYGRL